ncbi:MAG: tryptophan 7-halogenase [Asticcacaulis sp.]
MAQRRSILIVGGGTAGWLAACLFAKKLGGCDITLIESPEIGIVGVGEATFPTIRTTLKTIGLDEATFLRECHGTYKQGILFPDWRVKGETYFHPFDPPFYNREAIDLVPYWLLQNPAERLPFAEAVSFQKQVADAHRAPKWRHDKDFEGPLNHAFHFDTARFGVLLSRHAKAMGVRHLSGNMRAVRLSGRWRHRGRRHGRIRRTDGGFFHRLHGFPL